VMGDEILFHEFTDRGTEQLMILGKDGALDH
jgi:hypothetical protein